MEIPHKCTLLNISSRLGHPTFHFEMNGKIYFYGFQGIKADYKIVLYCTKTHLKSKCRNMVNILPSEFLKRIIQNTPNELKTSKYYSKILDKSDPRVYYIKNYDINSFKSCGAHNHPGKERAVYFPLKYTFLVKNTNVESVMEKIIRVKFPNV